MTYGLAVPTRGSSPGVPPDIHEAVELWARKYGRHGRVVRIDHFEPPLYQVRLTPRSGDPRKKQVQEGLIPKEEAEETVELHYWDEEKRKYVPYRLEELGASGVRRILEKGNTWSGRGEFDSVEEAVEHTQREREKAQRKLHKDRKDDIKHAASGVTRRRVLDVPAIRAGMDLSKQSPGGESDSKEND